MCPSLLHDVLPEPAVHYRLLDRVDLGFQHVEVVLCHLDRPLVALHPAQILQAVGGTGGALARKVGELVEPDRAARGHVPAVLCVQHVGRRVKHVATQRYCQWDR